MNNIQETLLFPIRDADARKQFLIACAVMLVTFIVPIVPSLIMMGYSARIMRQILEEKKVPSMPEWQGSNWSEMLTDGLHLWGAQMVLMLPLLLLMACGLILIASGSLSFAAVADRDSSSLAPLSMLLLMTGFLLFGLFSVLSVPHGILVAAALPHVTARHSFQPAFEFREWFAIFRKALGQFLLGYVLIMVTSFVFALVMQVALLTLILICILPLLMIPYMVYLQLIMNTVYAQAYAAGRDQLELIEHATP